VERHSDDSRVGIYDCNMFKIEATALEKCHFHPEMILAVEMYLQAPGNRSYQPSHSIKDTFCGPYFTNIRNKLKCLSLASLSNLF
jgi:hypothetical protein